MKIALYYYSASGNTKLACEYLRHRIPQVTLFNILDGPPSCLSDYDLIGFASSTYNLTLPPFFKDFLLSLDSVKGMPVFLLFTYGVMPGKIVKQSGSLLKNKGFQIIDYFTLRMPESYPPYIHKGITSENYPDEKGVRDFNCFLSDLDSNILSGQNISRPVERKIRLGFWNFILPVPSGKKIKKAFGTLKLDKAECNSCGNCQAACPRHAIAFDIFPSFQMDKCEFCYRCYNQCSRGAIRTSKIGEEARYKGPSKKLRELLNGN